MIFHVVMVAGGSLQWECQLVSEWVPADEQNICILYVCTTTLEAAGLWMSFPGDPEDCSKCVSVSLINSNTGAFGTCGQVNETQWEGTFSWFPPCQEAAGDGMRFTDSLPLSLSGPPLHQRDSLIPSLGTEAVEMYYSSTPHPSFSITTCWFSPSQFIFYWWDNQFGFVY